MAESRSGSLTPTRLARTALLLLLCCLAEIGGRGTSAAAQAPSDPTDQPKTLTTVVFESPIPLTKLIGRHVICANVAQGVVRDLLIDLHSGAIPVAIIHPERVADSRWRALALSAGSLQDDGNATHPWKISEEELVVMGVHTGEVHDLPVSRDRMHAILKGFGFEKDAEESRLQKAAGPWESVQGMIGMPVQNVSGRELGVLKEVVVDLATEQAAYTVLEVRHGDGTAGRRLIAVPLSAYVRGASPRTLTLEIDEKELSAQEAISMDALPDEISRAWIEYVSVRYGGDVRGGVQAPNQGSR